MDWVLGTVLHNLALLWGVTAILVIAAISLIRAQSPLTWKVVATVATILAIVITIGLTALKWHFRMEYPGNYPLAFHFLVAAVPVVGGAVAACVATLAFLRFRAVPPN